MAKIIFLIFILFPFINIGHPVNNNPTVIKAGKSIVIDGTIGKDEWEDAITFSLKQNEFADVKVMVKHDGKNLLLAYVNDIKKDSMYLLPEFFIDTQHDQAQKWEADDYWFHVSAQDCYSIGKREDYTHCSVDGEGWKAVPNYPFGNSFRKIEAFEIMVPFEFLRIKPGQRIGLCLSLAIYPGEYRINYPESSKEDIPATWMKVIIK
jgi:hypothetical protein